MTMEVHREYVGYLDEWDGTERLTDEEIVRCRDCRCMEQRVSFDGTVGWFLCTNFDRPTRRDGFCAWGERRGD